MSTKSLSVGTTLMALKLYSGMFLNGDATTNPFYSTVTACAAAESEAGNANFLVLVCAHAINDQTRSSMAHETQMTISRRGCSCPSFQISNQ